MLTEEDKADARRTSPWNKPLLLTIGKFQIRHDKSTLVAFQKTAGDPKYIGPVELKHVEETFCAQHVLTLDELYKLRPWVLKECRIKPLVFDSDMQMWIKTTKMAFVSDLVRLVVHVPMMHEICRFVLVEKMVSNEEELKNFDAARDYIKRWQKTDAYETLGRDAWFQNWVHHKLARQVLERGLSE